MTDQSEIPSSSATPPPPPTATRLADAVSMASDFGVAWVAVSAVQVLLGRSTPLDAARRLGIAGAASLALTRWLKHRFAVPRSDPPAPTSTMARTPTSSRFPSGHTLAAFCAALVVPRSAAGRLLATGFASLVAWSRVRVGHHHVVDVLAGAAVGTAAGALLAAVVPSGSSPKG